MESITTFLTWLFRQFGRASMLARLSMLFNIVLGWSIYVLHLNEDILRKELIGCHTLRYDDYRKIVEDQGILKKAVKQHESQISEIQENAENK